MFIFGGWNGHDTMDDIYQYSFGNYSPQIIIPTLVSNFWYEIKKVKGPRPSPRYRHTSVLCEGSMVIFGGVDTT